MLVYTHKCMSTVHTIPVNNLLNKLSHDPPTSTHLRARASTPRDLHLRQPLTFTKDIYLYICTTCTYMYASIYISFIFTSCGH